VPVPAPAAVRPSVRQPLRAPEPPARPALPVSPGPQRAPRGGEGQWRGGQSLCKFAPGDPWVSPPLPPAWAPFVPRVPQLREPPREAGGGGLYSNRGGGRPSRSGNRAGGLFCEFARARRALIIRAATSGGIGGEDGQRGGSSGLSQGGK
jgi:hypothetical protein